MAKRLAIVDQGQVVAEGTPEELKGELRGDTIQAELAERPVDGEVRGALERIGGVREIVLDDRSLRARVNSGATMLPSVLAALDNVGVTVASVTVARPSLDDVYLRYTGRAFTEADEGGNR